MPSIERNSSVPYYKQVYEQIANGINSGFYPCGKKLPSIRECARTLGVSNTTIELAYQKLVEEGYVEAKRGSGYTICAQNGKPANPIDHYTDEYRSYYNRLIDSSIIRDDELPLYDFAYDSVDSNTFPYITWARISREIFFDEGFEAACLYNDPQGLHALRVQIALYLNSEHGVSCTAEQILVMPTTRGLVAEILSLFNPADTTIAMENPGYDEVRMKLVEQGYTIKELSAFPYPTWDQAETDLEGAKIVFATPASQFPSNSEMPIEMRKKVVRWAQANDAYVIDDEYGWEFQSGFSRIPSLASLDNTGRIITLGTFSNSFTPAVCLSYAVLPPQLMLRWRAAHKGSHPQVPWQTQAAMAAFMRDDHWRTHIRKIRTSLQRKRELLLGSIATFMGDSVDVIEGKCSLFVLVKTNDGRNEQKLVEAAAKADIRVYPTSQFWFDDVPHDWRYVLVGYAGIPGENIAEGIKILAKAWEI